MFCFLLQSWLFGKSKHLELLEGIKILHLRRKGLKSSKKKVVSLIVSAFNFFTHFSFVFVREPFAYLFLFFLVSFGVFFLRNFLNCLGGIFLELVVLFRKFTLGNWCWAINSDDALWLFSIV